MAAANGSGNGGRVTLRDVMQIQREMYENIDRIKDELSSVKDGRVTLKDIMSLRNDLYKQFDGLNKEVTRLKIKVAMISVSVSIITSTVIGILTAYIKSGM